MRPADYFNLEKNVVFYKSYHSDKTNVLIHLLCIWNICWSAIFLLQYTPALTAFCPAAFGLRENLAFYVVALYVIVYILTDLTAGAIGSGLLIAIFKMSEDFLSKSDTIYGLQAWKVVLTIHVISWILQILGHQVFEKRAPSFMDNPAQAFLTAPLFVILEIMFYFGYRKELQKRCEPQVRENIKTFKEKNK